MAPTLVGLSGTGSTIGRSSEQVLCDALQTVIPPLRIDDSNSGPDMYNFFTVVGSYLTSLDEAHRELSSTDTEASRLARRTVREMAYYAWDWQQKLADSAQSGAVSPSESNGLHRAQRLVLRQWQAATGECPGVTPRG